jgi:D-tyrosyl-tRNA(Tyr) deacylase
MIALIQRVSQASVSIDGTVKSAIGHGLLLLLGIRNGDTQTDVEALARKSAALRIFADDNGKMNHSIADIDGEVLIISQFTLCADTHKGNRPSFIDAAPPPLAVPLYESFIEQLQTALGSNKVQTGEFGADMKVALTNDGPVTIQLTTDGKGN